MSFGGAYQERSVRRYTRTGLVLAHTALAVPFVVITVTATLSFAFATSFDEVVVAPFITDAEQRILPVQMFSGIRDQINPTIMAAATLLLGLSVVLFTVLTLLSRSRRVRVGILKGRSSWTLCGHYIWTNATEPSCLEERLRYLSPPIFLPG